MSLMFIIEEFVTFVSLMVNEDSEIPHLIGRPAHVQKVWLNIDIPLRAPPEYVQRG